MEKINLIDDFFLEAKENCTLTANGDYIFSYKLKLPPRYSLSKEHISEVFNNWQRALRGLPTHTFLFKSDIYSKKTFDLDMGDESFIEKQNTAHFKGKPYLGHESYLFLIFPSEISHSRQMRNPFAVTRTVTETDLTKLTKVSDEFKRTLASDFVKIEPLELKDVKNYSIAWWNAMQMEFTTDLEAKDDYISIGSRRAGVVAITSEKQFDDNVEYVVKDIKFSKEMADFTFYGGLPDDCGLSLEFDHIYNQVIRIADNKVVMDKIVKDINNFKALKKISYQNGLAAKELQSYLEDIQSMDQSALGFAHCHTNIVFFADNQEDFKRYRTEVIDKLKKMAVPYIPTGKRLQNLFYNTFFANISCLDEDSLYLVTSNIACLQILCNSNYNGDDIGVWFQDRMFQKPFKFDFWNATKSRINARNFIIFSPTGNGKSVLANSLITGLKSLRYPEYDVDGNKTGESGVISVIIDCGRSYEKMSVIYPKEEVFYFRYVAGMNLGLNPFALLNGKMPNEIQIESLCELVWLLIRQGKVANNNEKTSLRDIIGFYYEYKRKEKTLESVSWGDFYNFVKDLGKELLNVLKIEERFFDLAEFLHNGKNFTTGAFKNVFAPNAELSKSFIDKKMIIFELEDIKDHDILLPIVLQIIYTVISQVIWDKSKKGCLLMDEFAQLLQKGDVFNRVAYIAQTVRKQEGMLGLILQTPGQLPNSENTKNIIANSETIFMLPTDKKKVIEDVVEICGLSKHEHAMMLSMKHDFTCERPYSEFFVHSGKSAFVGRLELPSKVLALYQTNSDDTLLLMKNYEKFDGNMEAAIDGYLNAKLNLNSTN